MTVLTSGHAIPPQPSGKLSPDLTAWAGNKKMYNHRESNPGYLDGNEICYHYTMIVELTKC